MPTGNGATTTRIDHRHVKPAAWREILHEFSVGLNPGSLQRSSAIHQALAEDLPASIVIQYLSQMPVTFEFPHQAVEALDRLLRSQVEAYEAR